MAQFFGCTVKPDDPVVINPGDEEEMELNITGCTVSKGKPGKTSFLYIQADDGDSFCVAALVPGRRDHQRLELQLGHGNEKIVFSVSGYTTLVENYEIESSDDESGEEEDVTAGATPLAQTEHGTAFLVGGGVWVGDSASDDSDDEEFAEAAGAAAVAGSSEEDSDEEEEDGEEDSGDDDSDDSSDDDDEFGARAGVQAVLKRKAEAPPASATPKAKKAAKATKTPPAAAPATPAGAASGPEAQYKEALVSYLSANGASPLSKVGSACKKPAGLSGKLKAFLKGLPSVFSVDNDKVNLV